MSSLNNIKISKKLPFLIVLCALVSSIFIGSLSYVQARKAIIYGQQENLLAMKESRKQQLGDYLGSIEEDLIAVSSNPYTLEALRSFTSGWDNIGFQGNQTEILQKLYITDNPHETGQKEKLDFAHDGSLYSQAHASYHPWFRSFLNAREYYDIFLFDLQGNLVYTVFKELDYATNINKGEWKDTDLGNVYRASRNGAKIGEKAFFDFKPYAPSFDAPASFISTPIMNENGNIEGVVVFQMPIGRINNIMQAAAGMGETGETYVVGEDFLMRSDSRFSEESTILKIKVDGATAIAGLKGENGVEIVKDYRGINVVSAYTPFEFLGAKWTILAEIDEAEMLAPIVRMRNITIITLLILGSIIVAIGVFFSRMITAPISTITQAMEVLSKGDTSVIVPESERKDEIGDMARALEIFKQNRIESDHLTEKQEVEQKTQLDRAANLEKLTSDFDIGISELVNTLSSATTELNATAQSMSSISEETTTQSTAISSASEATTGNIQTVASAAEELTASIHELRQQVDGVSQAASAAVSDVDIAAAQINGLMTASEEIGNVVKVIQDIAEQTNLLALNATIESARAGDAGKGFAVVANEVKSLAMETSKATEQISEQVATVQKETRGAVEAVKNIEIKIKDVSTAAAAIATAIAEQNSATEEISRTTQLSATNMQELNNNVANVNEVASNTGSAANDVLTASSELAKQSDSLKSIVSSFLEKVKSA